MKYYYNGLTVIIVCNVNPNSASIFSAAEMSMNFACKSYTLNVHFDFAKAD